jgi:AmmeMemoRadiSam system protein B
MHIPYLRHMFTDNPDVKLIPLMVGHVPEENFDLFGEVLAPYFLDKETLFVISTDFCHWGKRFRYTHTFEPEKIKEGS